MPIPETASLPTAPTPLLTQSQMAVTAVRSPAEVSERPWALHPQPTEPYSPGPDIQDRRCSWVTQGVTEWVRMTSLDAAFKIREGVVDPDKPAHLASAPKQSEGESRPDWETEGLHLHFHGTGVPGWL